MFKLKRLEITGFKSFADYTDLIFTGAGITGVVGPNGCGKCVSGDTLVTLADGRDVPIRKLVQQALAAAPASETMADGVLTRHNPHGVEVLSLNPDTLRLEPRPVAAFVQRTATPYLLRVRTRSGREVTATPYHPLFTLEKGQLRALKAEELRVGVRLALPRCLPIAGHETPLPLFDALKSFQPEDSVFVPHSNALATWAAAGHAQFGTWGAWAHAAGVSGNQLKGLLDGQAIGAAALVKLAGAARLEPPLETLRGLTQSINPNHDLIPGATKLVKEAAQKAGLKLKPHRRQYPKLAAYVGQQCAASRGGLLEVIKQIERLGATPASAHDLLQRLTVLATSDVYWDEIISIEQVAPPDEWVYDLCVAGTHNFVAGNIIVHNSNVADAIAWVLGEQRVKHLRGAAMLDVIFQGSRNRAPSGMAEVVLHLVRDETMPDETDVDDIDSALEEIDEQREVVAEKLLPELAGAAHTEQPEQATAQTGAVVAVDVAASVEDANDTAALSAPAAATAEALTEKAQHAHPKRHWRPRRMALDFAPGETVSVTRRLYRDGESEYLLNGRICRLRDIQDLFSGTGLSGAHYAIIEQGRIGQILSAKPMDRRTLIEEAAGITKFRVRQRAAEARLEGARANLRRISDIIAEIERQVGSLRRQAGKARRYRQLREELRELLRRVYAADERALTVALEELRTYLAAAGEQERELIAAVEQHEEEARLATTDARGCEAALAEARAAVADAALQHDRRERERTYRQEQTRELERRMADVTAQMESLRERLESVGRERESLRANDVQLRTESETSAQLLQAAEEVYARRSTEVLAAEQQIEEARADLLTHTAVAERLHETGRQLDATLERLALQAEGLEREGERARAAHEEATAQAETLQAELTTARAQLAQLLVERAAANVGAMAARSLVSATATEYARAREEAARVSHRLDTLAELDTQRALYSPAVQRIFSEERAADATGADGFHAVGTLADMLQVEPQWERAVESVFGAYLQTVIVPTPDDAVRAAAWLQMSGAGRATFLVAGLQGASADEAHARGVMDGGAQDDVRLGNLLGASAEMVTILRRTLPREMNARVAGDLEQALILSLATGELYVTSEGEWVAGGQLIGAGGPVGAITEGPGLLAFKREIRELETRAAALMSEVVSAEDSVTAARARLVELEDALMLLNEQIGRAEREQVARELQAAQLTQEIERAARHVRVVADDRARLAAEREELETRRAKQTADADAAEAARLAATQAVAGATELLAQARRTAEAENEQLSIQRAAAATAAERRRATAAELRRMEAEAAELAARLARHEMEVAEMGEQLAALQASLAASAESAGTVEDERTLLEQTVAECAAQLTDARARADEMAAELTELHNRAAAARDARAAMEVNRAEATARLGYLRETCAAELNQPLAEIAAAYQPAAEFDLAAERARVEELRARLESFGAVNMMALEELAEAEERFTFLTTQRQDITDGIGSTEEALREIKRRSRERFRHAFAEINRNFGVLFLELFGGGRGEMSLIDVDDPLESGIDLVAQPPGKRLQNVLLLSGGEKAMAALALVLAIFRYHPSPFCLLDEVDAPLDEANIGRFAAKIMEMATDTQFIVITHNKRTMEAARALYGVTMEEVGVSKLVSVRFE